MEVNLVGTHVFNGTLKDLGRLDFASHGADMETRPKKEERRRQRQKQKTKPSKHSKLK